jgi:hypothetical protein
VIPVLGFGFWLGLCRTVSLVQAGRRGRCSFLKGIRTRARGWLLAATPATRRRRAHNSLDYDALEYFFPGHWQCLGGAFRWHMLTGLSDNWTWQLIVTSLHRNGIFVHGWCGRQMPGSICGNRFKRGLHYGSGPGRGSEVRHIVGGGRDIHPTAEADTGPRCKINATKKMQGGEELCICQQNRESYILVLLLSVLWNGIMLMPIRIRLSILMSIQIRIRDRILPQLFIHVKKSEFFWLLFTAMPDYNNISFFIVIGVIALNLMYSIMKISEKI